VADRDSGIAAVDLGAAATEITGTAVATDMADMVTVATGTEVTATMVMATTDMDMVGAMVAGGVTVMAGVTAADGAMAGDPAGVTAGAVGVATDGGFSTTSSDWR
jgi:hypothetical protein